jgi:ACS family allantoate permease-like MFS transporter
VYVPQPADDYFAYLSLLSHAKQQIDLDKQSINYAAIFGLSEDLELSGTEFSWAISLFYFGQLCSEYPAAYLMSRLPITVFVGVTM